MAASMGESLGWVLHARAAHYEGTGVGSTSVKSFSGPAQYDLGGRSVVVDAGHYLS